MASADRQWLNNEDLASLPSTSTEGGSCSYGMLQLPKSSFRQLGKPRTAQRFLWVIRFSWWFPTRWLWKTSAAHKSIHVHTPYCTAGILWFPLQWFQPQPLMKPRIRQPQDPVLTVTMWPLLASNTLDPWCCRPDSYLVFVYLSVFLWFCGSGSILCNPGEHPIDDQRSLCWDVRPSFSWYDYGFLCLFARKPASLCPLVRWTNCFSVHRIVRVSSACLFDLTVGCLPVYDLCLCGHSPFDWFLACLLQGPCDCQFVCACANMIVRLID